MGNPKKIVTIALVYIGIALVFYSYVKMNFAPTCERWSSYYAWDPVTKALVQPLGTDGAYQTFILKSWLDEKIPFVPVLSLPYVSFLILVPIVVPALNLMARSMKRFLTLMSSI